MRLIAEHPAVHAIVYLGIGIQSNQARMMRDGPLLPGPRPRAHRRLPRAPGRPLRRGRRRAQPSDGQADPHRHRAGRRRPGQRRPGDGAGERAAVLPERQPRRHRPRPPLPRRPPPGPPAAVSRRAGAPAVNPIVVLDRPGADPGAAAVRRCGAGPTARAEGADPPPSVDVAPPPAPSPALATPLLSFRRTPARARPRRQPRRRSRREVDGVRRDARRPVVRRRRRRRRRRSARRAPTCR